jgi:hypothetical protein
MLKQANEQQGGEDDGANVTVTPPPFEQQDN